jgi:hypothetical protein
MLFFRVYKTGPFLHFFVHDLRRRFGKRTVCDTDLESALDADLEIALPNDSNTKLFVHAD